MKKCLIIAAFCGCGKTFINENLNLNSIEIEYWKYNDNEKYVQDIKEAINIYDYIFISTDPRNLKLIYNEGIDIILVYPENNLRNEYLDRYINRNSSPDFIGIFMINWNNWIDELKTIKYCKHFILKSNQYLNNVINIL